MLILGGIFFVFVPTVLLFTITQLGNVDAVSQLSPGPRGAPREGPGRDPGRHRAGPGRLRPRRLPLRPGRGGGADHHLDRRRAPPPSSASASGAPASSSPTPPPGSGRSSSASWPPACSPATLTTIVGFGIYSLIVNTIVGPDVGGWFFPTSQWWVLMLWVVPPFLALTLSLVLRLSAKVKSTAAAQQASALVSLPLIMVAYSQATGSLYGGNAPRLVHRRRSPGCSPASPSGAASASSPAAASSASPTSSSAATGRALHGGDQLVGAAEREAGHRPVRVADDALARRSRTPSAGRSRAGRGCRRPRPRPCRCRRAAGTRTRPACTRSRRGSAPTAGEIASTWAPASVKESMSSV